MLVLLGITIFTAFVSAHAEIQSTRFFLMGDGRIHLKNTHSGLEARVTLVNPDGSLNEKAFNAVDRVFGFPTSDRGEHISPRLIFMLDHFSDRIAPGKPINIDSGYRSPQYNSRLRDTGANAARTSTHIDGMALDFFIDGVKGKELWEMIRAAECCGVGHYGGKNVHLDSARPRFWEAATSKVTTGESDYNRRIYLSTDYDRYKTGEDVRLSLSSVSDFGFGVKRSVSFVTNAQGSEIGVTSAIRAADGVECLMVRDRKTSRFLRAAVPEGLSEGRYRVRIEFCERPFEQMPIEILSNEVEIAGSDAR
jgi:uncharacterized protein YcbK (DUF882 family)